MQITKLKLRGFLGIKKGLGLDEIELNFAGLSGLVALSGPNGHGKTTILDNLHPYRTLASRAGALQNHCCLRDSFKELSFIHQGAEYRTLVKIDSQSGKQEGFVWKNDEPQVDGKAKNYDQYIEALLGSPSLFFNSVFAAQGGAKLSDLTAGELKKLFSEFLRLDKLIEYEETAKACGNALAVSIAMAGKDIDRLQATVTQLDGIEAQLLIKDQEISAVTDGLTLNRSRLAAIEKEISDLTTQAAAENATKLRIADLQAESSRLFDEIAVDENRAEQLGIQLQKGLDKARVDLGAEKMLLAEKDAIQNAVQQIKEAKVARADCMFALTLARKEQRLFGVDERDASDQHQKHINRLDRLSQNAEVTRLTREIAMAKRDSADLDRRDPSCQSKTCSFIVRALQAKESLPKLESDLSSIQAEIEKVAEGLRAEIAKLGGLKADAASSLQKVTDKISTIEEKDGNLARKISGLEPLAAKESRILVAEANIEKLQAAIDEKVKAISQAIADASAAKHAKAGRMGELINTINTLSSSVTDIAGKLEAAEKNAAQVKVSIDTASKLWMDLRTEKAGIEKDCATLADASVELSKAQERKTAIATEQAEWRYIQNACSKDGLRALEIDSVAPSISGYANDILSKTFGPSQSVRFRTQDPETGREILDIMVIREDGNETPLENLSGGEKVWSLKALRLAMTLISKERSGKAFTSSFADEEDGALDADNAQSFIRMYQSFMATGGFDTCFFISHRPECVSMADHQLNFSKGGVTIQ